MCCFSGPVTSVANTRIFARWVVGGKTPRQAVVYQMSYAAKRDLAMILPIPVVAGSDEKAVSFINLEKAPEFFSKLGDLFQVGTFGKTPMPLAAEMSRAKPKLEVIKVGSFEASFVPTVADFARLDEAFKLKDDVWAKLPQYKDWGFAVFKLRKETTTVHPMAFSYPSALPQNGLFFPTVHIHDGKVHAEEAFDHTLYCQVPKGLQQPPRWSESPKLPSSINDLKDEGLLIRDAHVYRRELVGKLPNRDTWA